MMQPIYCTGPCDDCKDYARELGVPLVVMPPYGHQPVLKSGITGGYSWACPACGVEVTSWYLPPRLGTADRRCVSEAELAAALDKLDTGPDGEYSHTYNVDSSEAFARDIFAALPQ